MDGQLNVASSLRDESTCSTRPRDVRLKHSTESGQMEGPDAEAVMGGSLADLERMLAEDYGLGDGEAEAKAETPVPEPPQKKRWDRSEHDITSLDGPNFSVDAWLEAKKSLGLETLLQQQRTLRADITRFKNNTQTLVHDNYSRFITAADIIKTMRSEFETMVLDTDNLKSTMDSATNSSASMNDSLQEKRSQLSTLLEVQKLIQQLQMIRDLPEALRRLVDSKDFGSAVLLYSNMQPMLQAHGHIGFLRPMSREAHEIMKGTHEELIGLLEDAEASEKSVHATVQMLRLLAMPTREIQQAFLSGRELCVQNQLKLARMAAQGAAKHACRTQDFSTTGQGTEWQNVDHFLETLGSNVFPRVHGMLEVYTGVFGSPNEDRSVRDERVTSVAEGLLKAYIATAQWGLAAHSIVAVATSAPLHLNVVDTLPEERKGAPQDVFNGDFGAADMISAVNKLMQDAAQQAEFMNSDSLQAHAGTVAVGAWRYCLGCAVSGVEQTIINLLLRAMFDIIAQPGSRTSAQACISLCSSALAQGCELLASSFLPASVQAAHADSDFPELVQSELQRLLLSVKTRCYSLACGPLEDGWEPVLCSRTELGFKGSMMATLSKHNPLFPPSPTAHTPSESLSAQLDAHEGATAMMATPEPYSCAPDVEMPEVVPSLMHIVSYLMIEELRTTVVVKVVESVALHGAHDQASGHSVRETPPFVPKAVQEQLAASAKRVLQQFVLQKSASAVDTIKAAFSDEAFLKLQPADVTPPRAWVQTVLQVIQGIVEEASILLPPGDPLPKFLVPGQQHTRGSSMDAHPDHSSLFSSQITPGLFRESGVPHLPDITGTVFSVTLAACTHLLQVAVDTMQGLTGEAGCVHQCQVDILAFKGSVDMQQTLPFYQDIVAACESACSSNGSVALLDQAQLEALLSQR